MTTNPTPNDASALPAPILHLLALLLVIATCVIAFSRPVFRGDGAEYALMAISLAEHGSLDVTPSDARLAKEYVPDFA